MHTQPRRVILESPYTGVTPGIHQRNIRYARRAMADSLARGEAPIAAHLLYAQPGVLDNTDTTQRQQGIEAGLAWGPAAAATVVYADYNITPGMREGIEHARVANRPIDMRIIGGNPDDDVDASTGPIEEIFAEVERLMAVDAVHRTHGPISCIKIDEIIEHVAKELVELKDDPMNIHEGADVLVSFLHYVKRRNWTLKQLRDAAFYKISLRFTG